jgi:hypothetical protein
MRNSALWQTLRSLDRRDQRALGQWLDSNLHCTRDDVRALYRYLISRLETTEPNGVQKEQIWQVLSPTEVYDERQFNHLMSWLLAAVRDFLAWQEWQSDRSNVDLYRCRALRRRGLDGQFEQELAKATTYLNAQPHRDEHYHRMSRLLLREQLEHQSLRTRDTSGLPLQRIRAHSEAAHRLLELQMACTEAVAQTVPSRTASPEVPPVEQVTVRVYEHLYAALRASNPVQGDLAFAEAKALLLTQWATFREQERRTPYLLALNYAIRRGNQGAQGFLRDTFDLYRTGLDNRALFEQGRLSKFTFLNITTTALVLGEADWARDFIEQHSIALPPRERHALRSYALALCHLHTREHGPVLELLRDVDFGDDPLTGAAARAILLRVHYEEGHLDSLESLLGSFDKYLRHHRKTLGYRYDNYANLLGFARRLLRVRSATERQQIRGDIEATAALAERAWLLRMLGDR